MKAALVLLALVVCAAALKDNDLVSDARTVAQLNAVNGAGWTAAVQFPLLTFGQAKRMCGTRIPAARPVMRRAQLVALPDAFDWSKQTPNCVHKVLDQGQCGSCWAFGATEALSDRLCIASKGQTNVILSAQYIVSCDTTDYGCGGGYLENAWEFLQSTGVPTAACVSYQSASGSAPDCPTTCDDGSALKMYKSGSPSAFVGETAMMNEIYANGPIEAAFDVYNDFFSYSSGIYKHVSGSLAGGHAIKIYGWGVQNGQKFWIVQNSWGTSWGIAGSFWIAKGSDECGIEDNGEAGPAAL